MKGSFAAARSATESVNAINTHCAAVIPRTLTIHSLRAYLRCSAALSMPAQAHTSSMPPQRREHADAANSLVVDLDRQPAGDCQHIEHVDDERLRIFPEAGTEPRRR
jgi:hypothetical protein